MNLDKPFVLLISSLTWIPMVSFYGLDLVLNNAIISMVGMVCILAMIWLWCFKLDEKEEHDKVCDKRQYKSILDDENE